MKKLLTIMVCVTFINSKSIMHLASIKRNYEENKNFQTFLKNKEDLIKYYENGEFETEVEKKCQEALSHIRSLVKTDNDAIIFDVDETALLHYPLFKEKNFDWSLDDDVIPYRQKAICPAIQPVLKFYTTLIQENYKVIFLTSRRDTTHAATIQNLINEGFKNYTELFLMPMDLFEKGVKHEMWKAEVRKNLSKKYNIIASISDSKKDFDGGNTGFCIKLPNYLY